MQKIASAVEGETLADENLPSPPPTSWLHDARKLLLNSIASEDQEKAHEESMNAFYLTKASVIALHPHRPPLQSPQQPLAASALGNLSDLDIFLDIWTGLLRDMHSTQKNNHVEGAVVPGEIVSLSARVVVNAADKAYTVSSHVKVGAG